MRDYRNWWASRTAAHVKDVVGRGSHFEEGLFDVDPSHPKTLPIWDNYRLEFDDRGSFIDVRISGDSGKDLSIRLSNLNVPPEYRDVVTSVKYVKGEEGTVRVRFKEMNNASGRTQNEAKLFFSVYNSAIKPIFRAIN